MRHLISGLGVLFILMASFLYAEKAHAKYSICNKTSYAMRAAIGYVDVDRLATRGWWPLNSGECKIVLSEEVKPGRYFVYAEAIEGHKGPKRTWSGDSTLCVQNSGFFNLRNQESCRTEPENQRNFMDVEVKSGGNGTYTTDLVEPNIYTITSAEVAGVQRLMSDVGIPVRRVDGTMGRETRRAIATYRKNRGLANGNFIDDQLMESLINEANTIDAKLGFFYCNKAGEEVWSAIAYNEKGDEYISQGWWHLDPGQCVKVIKGKLEKSHYYVYGVMGDGSDENPERVLAGGDRNLCTNDILFKINNSKPCEEQGINIGAFKRVEIGGSPAATYDFLPDAFIIPPLANSQTNNAASNPPATAPAPSGQ